MDIPWGVDEWFTGALSVGAKGAVGSSFNFAPALYQKLMKSFAEGDVETARDCQWKSVQMINILASKGYMGCAKALMGWLGVDLGPARLPQGNPTAGTAQGTPLRAGSHRLLPVVHELNRFPSYGCNT